VWGWTIPHASDDLKEVAAGYPSWFDGVMADREFVVGDRYTLADIILFAFLEFGGAVGQPISPELSNITRWYEGLAPGRDTQASA
jgi:glutathione S-transferase